MANHKLPVIVLSILLLFSASFIVYLFYNQEFKNNLPARIPVGYKPTYIGQQFANTATKKLQLLHFFNPDCPCSRFNTKHILELKNKFFSQVDFVGYTITQISYSYPIRVIYDADASVAKKYGVYSTPQAVLLDHSGKLLYRGNYNKSKYCGAKKTQYVAFAIVNALKKLETQSIMEKSGLPYGCAINFANN